MDLRNKKAKMSKFENALIWLYVKTWGKFGDHIIAEKDLWKFNDADLERAIMGLAYPRKKPKLDRVKDLTGLIMGKFEDGGPAAFREWSAIIHDQVIDSLPQTVEVGTVDEQGMNADQKLPLVKILKWDPGNYFYRNISRLY